MTLILSSPLGRSALTALENFDGSNVRVQQRYMCGPSGTATLQISHMDDPLVLGWREVPTDGSILGPAASSTEPKGLQAFVVLLSHYGEDSEVKAARLTRNISRANTQARYPYYVCHSCFSYSKSKLKPT
jgi:glutamate synthase domain-containing protein 1